MQNKRKDNSDTEFVFVVCVHMGIIYSLRDWAEPGMGQGQD